MSKLIDLEEPEREADRAAERRMKQGERRALQAFRVLFDDEPDPVSHCDARVLTMLFVGEMLLTEIRTARG